MLSGDILYVGGAGLPAYSPVNNNLYQQMEDDDADLSSATVLVRTTQSAHTGVPAAATAGVMTTRAAAQSFFVAGTNRAMFRFTMMNHMCKDMEQVHDVHLPPDRIRQDVSRSPGGDSRHLPEQLHRLPQRHGSAGAGLCVLQLRRDGRTHRLHARRRAAEVPHQHGQLQTRLRHAATMAGTTTGAQGANTVLGWSSQLPGSGNGAKSMGQELANSDQFARCQVEKVFKTVCLRPPVNSADRDPRSIASSACSAAAATG